MSTNSRRTAFISVLAGAPFVFGCVEPWSASVLAWLLVAVAAAESMKAGLDSRSLFAASPFLLAVVIGSIQLFHAAPVDGPALGAATTASRHGTLWGIAMWGALAAASALGRQFGVNRRAAIMAFWAISISAALIALVGILQSLSETESLYWLRPIPIGSYMVFGPYYNRNHAGNLFLMTLPLAVYCFWEATRRGPRGADGVAKTMVLFLPTVAIISGVVYCGSLASLAIAFMALMAISEVLWRRRTHLWLLLALILAGGGVCAYNARLIAAHHTVSTRLSLWRSAARISRDFPLLGIGLGAFEAAFRPYKEEVLLGFGDHAHNDWLELACEIGRPAAGVVVIILLGAAFSGVVKGRDERLPAAAAGISALAFILHATVDFPLHIPANGVVFAAMIGISSSHALGASDRFKSVRLFPAMLFSAIAMLCFYVTATLGLSDASLKWAHLNSSPEQKERWKDIAYRLDSSGARVTRDIAAELVNRAVLHKDKSSANTALRLSARHLAVEPFDSSLILSRAHALRVLGRENDSRQAIAEYFQLVPWARPVAVNRGSL